MKPDGRKQGKNQRNYLECSTKKTTGAGRGVQEVKCLPSNHEALSSKASTTKTKINNKTTGGVGKLGNFWTFWGKGNFHKKLWRIF
jgi:hypothetical protein